MYRSAQFRGKRSHHSLRRRWLGTCRRRRAHYDTSTLLGETNFLEHWHLSEQHFEAEDFLHNRLFVDELKKLRLNYLELSKMQILWSNQISRWSRTTSANPFVIFATHSRSAGCCGSFQCKFDLYRDFRWSVYESTLVFYASETSGTQSLTSVGLKAWLAWAGSQNHQSRSSTLDPSWSGNRN